eukprot:m.175813 g.175813  ORF g.175813 m.175813 type:complete len:136 (-) comp14893_c0_seq3:1900-2307(-)
MGWSNGWAAGRWALLLLGLASLVAPLWGACLVPPNNAGHVDLPASTTALPLNAFFRCTTLVSINLHSGLTLIGNQAFRECTNLTSVVIPDSVVSLGASVFIGCSSLASVQLSRRITTVATRTGLLAGRGDLDRHP